MENTRPRRGSYTTSLSYTGRDTTTAVTSFLPKAVGTPLSNMSNTSRLLSTRRLVLTPDGWPARASGNVADLATGVYTAFTLFFGGILVVLCVRQTMWATRRFFRRRKTSKKMN
eukprot:GHVQ01034835.1.p1 GENE.GHVQ01034835.1~~GHVQ01034835.1.p1  ORF type:complete len:114 (+),score=7.03 GHVQ01034835.1:194-535(+)